AVWIDIGKEIDGFFYRERMTLEAEALGQGHRPANFTPPFRRGGEPERSDFPPVNRLSRLGFKSVKDLNRVLHQSGEVLAAAQLADQSCGMPGAPVGDLRFLEKQDVAFAAPGQSTGDRATDRPAADDDDACMAIERPWHQPRPLPVLLFLTS